MDNGQQTTDNSFEKIITAVRCLLSYY